MGEGEDISSPAEEEIGGLGIISTPPLPWEEEEEAFFASIFPFSLFLRESKCGTAGACTVEKKKWKLLLEPKAILPSVRFSKRKIINSSSLFLRRHLFNFSP